MRLINGTALIFCTRVGSHGKDLAKSIGQTDLFKHALWCGLEERVCGLAGTDSASPTRVNYVGIKYTRAENACRSRYRVSVVEYA